MAGEPDPQDRGGLLEPVGADESLLHVEIGGDVELSPEVREALDTLLRELQGAEVEGFVPICPSLDACEGYHCAEACGAATHS